MKKLVRNYKENRFDQETIEKLNSYKENAIKVLNDFNTAIDERGNDAWLQKERTKIVDKVNAINALYDKIVDNQYISRQVTYDIDIELIDELDEAMSFMQTLVDQLTK